jgi:hypothetical protein
MLPLCYCPSIRLTAQKNQRIRTRIGCFREKFVRYSTVLGQRLVENTKPRTYSRVLSNGIAWLRLDVLVKQGLTDYVRAPIVRGTPNTKIRPILAILKHHGPLNYVCNLPRPALMSILVKLVGRGLIQSGSKRCLISLKIRFRKVTFACMGICLYRSLCNARSMQIPLVVGFEPSYGSACESGDLSQSSLRALRAAKIFNALSTISL